MGLNNFTTATGPAEFTDIEAQSLGLPSGYEVGEDNGDLVVRDTNGTIALRRVDGGNWSFESNTVETGPLVAESADVTNQVTSNSVDTASLDSDEITNSGQVQTTDLDVSGSAGSLAADSVDVANSFRAGPLSLSSNLANPTELFTLLGSNTNLGFGFSTETTIDGDNNPDGLIDVINQNNIRSGIAFVIGHQQADPGFAFTDIVATAGLASTGFQTLELNDRNNVTRSYSFLSGVVKLAIDDPGQTYSISVVFIGGDKV
jgi:hypothetical protein